MAEYLPGEIALTDISAGNVIRFNYKGTTFTGTVISVMNGAVNLKLSNGYNLSVPPDSMADIEILGETHSVPEEQIREASKGPVNVGILATGGTIASRVDYVTGAVKPVLNPAFLEDSVPNISEFTLDLDLMEPVLSENLQPDDWIAIARRAKRMLDKNGRCIILHGTDTMSYTASALSFMFSELAGPVVMVGSQRSSDRPSSDAFLNLEAALEFCREEIGEVGVAMHGTIQENEVALHRGVRVRKMHTSRRDAFRTIGSSPLATYQGGKVTFSQDPYKPSDKSALIDKLDRNVSLVYFHPALGENDLGLLLENRRAAVIMGTGLGHVASRFYPVLRKSIRDGTRVIMTSQCIGGSVNMNVYSTGRELLSIGVIPAGSMLPEVAMVKSMHILANYDDEHFTEIFMKNLRGEYLQRESMAGVSVP